MTRTEKRKPMKQWRVGSYERLSKEDANSGTSVSIEHQKAIILDFIEKDPLQFMLVDSYTEACEIIEPTQRA